MKTNTLVKELDATNRQQSNEDTLLSKLYLDDTSKNSQLKVVIAYPS